MVYFDYNATSPLHPAARQAWLEAADLFIGNPSSPHRLGSRAENALLAARERLAAILGCDPLDLVFTSGATESNNAVFHDLARRHPAGEIWVSALEHPSVLEAARKYFDRRARIIPAPRSGCLDLDWVQTQLKSSRPLLLVCMAANNETGVLQPWRELAGIAAAREIPVFCDATQWLGRLPAAGLGALAYLSGSAHKFGGPRGVGFLKHPGSRPLDPLIAGGGQQDGRRAGTENLPGILAMAAALEAREARLRESPPPSHAREFERNLEACVPGAEIVARESERLWNTVFALMPQADGQRRWVVKLDKIGFAVSTGSACSSGKEQPSHVLRAMGYSPAEASRALRFSGGWETTREDWRALGEALAKVHRDMQRAER